jgi:hypothetical protein
MSCAVDATAWGEKNRVQLATGKVQRWILARTTRDAPTLGSVADTTRAVLVKWFPHSTPLDPLFADAGDAVDAITIHGIYDRAPAPGSKDQRRENLNPVPMLAPSSTPPLYVEVSFNYRGWAKSMPWPVWTADNVSFLRSSKLCPLDADWMLVSAQDLATLPDAPTEASWLEKLAQNAPGPLATGAELVQLATWGLVFYAGVQLFGFARAVLPKGRRA